MKTLLLLTMVALGASWSACKSDETTTTNPYPKGHKSDFPTCDAIIKQCHPFDFGEGAIHDCHDLGHAALSDDECVAKKDDCLTRICVAQPDSGTQDSGTQDSGVQDAADQ